MRSRPLLLASLLAIAATLGGCIQSHERIDLPVVGESTEMLVGPAGATLALTGIEITIPAGALSSERSVRVTVVEESPPSWLRPSSPILRFEPEGLEFDVPIEVRIPFTGNPATATVFWSQREGDAFVPRSTRVQGRVAIAQSTHFSQAFVGSACEGDDCCDQANGRLDVVLVVDNSGSMAEEQAALAAQIPRLARALASGDSDGDGVQDFPALESVRVGIVSSDMGVGGRAVPSCDRGATGPAFGDDGRFRTSGVDLSCGATSYPLFAEVGADSSSTEVDAFVEHVGCVARLGTAGCGFEQQLEAMLKAVTPSTSSIRFLDDTVGHADGINGGFLRDDSMLAIVTLTDEDDCSTIDPELLDPTSETYNSVDLNLRCHAFPALVHGTQRYVDGLLAVRDQPADVIFATVAGVPVDALEGGSSLDTILADARMQEVIDPTMPTRLTPSCAVPGIGNAFPPRRIVQVARDLENEGAHAVVGSICQDDFTPVIDAILSRVASRARGECR